MRFIILLIMMAGFIYANTQMQIKKGWQLIGVPTSLDVQTSFNNKNVEIVWGFDASTQSWSGYSPDEDKSAKITKDYSTLTDLEPYQALWIFSKDDWQFSFSSTDSLSTPINNTIVLQDGWNLIALPQQIVVSDKFFGDAIVWKYSADQEWSVNDSSLDFPSIDTVTQSEGLWVKSEGAKSISVNDQAASLHTFKSKDSMLSYIRNMVKMSQYYYAYGIAVDGVLESNDAGAIEAPTDSPVADSSTKASDATTTNLQESGVDEGDILKHDGKYIFNIDNTNGKIIVSSFENISQKVYTPITSIDFSNKNIVDIYLQNSRLSVISYGTNNSFTYDEMNYAQVDTAIANYQSSVKLDIFDVSDINNIKLIAEHSIDGNYQDSRLIDGELFLISQYTPRVSYEYPKIYEETVCSSLDRSDIFASCSSSSVVNSPVPVEPTEVTSRDSKEVSTSFYEESCVYGEDYTLWHENSCYKYSYDENGAWRYDYENPTIVDESLIPTIKSNTQDTQDLVTHSKLYAPAKLSQRASITTLSSFLIESGEYKISNSFLGNTHTYYASLTSLYLVSSEYPLYYDYNNYKEQQMIYKFALDDTLTYKGRGSIEGRMLNQFSMSEKDDYLRVASSSGWNWFNGGETTNTVYTLKQTNNTLKVEGTLSGLGHEGETIRSVRFMGDRGFVVTFKQTDPLYTLDMSNPKEPKVVGELSIPGFSTYLHIVDENRVLSIGRDADENGAQLGLQFQLFDISDFSNPILADKIQIGNEYSYSEAEYNHKAFTYRSSDLMFGVPYRNYSRIDNTSSENFGMFQVDDLSLKSIHTITSDNSNWGDVGRGLIFDMNSTTYGSLFKGSNITCENIQKKEI